MLNEFLNLLFWPWVNKSTENSNYGRMNERRISNKSEVRVKPQVLGKIFTEKKTFPNNILFI